MLVDRVDMDGELALRERVEDAVGALGLDDRAHLLERDGLHGVLQPGEGLGVHRREQVEAGREQLAHLDAGRLHPLEVAREPLGPVGLVGPV